MMALAATASIACGSPEQSRTDTPSTAVEDALWEIDEVKRGLIARLGGTLEGYFVDESGEHNAIACASDPTSELTAYRNAGTLARGMIKEEVKYADGSDTPRVVTAFSNKSERVETENGGAVVCTRSSTDDRNIVAVEGL